MTAGPTGELRTGPWTVRRPAGGVGEKEGWGFHSEAEPTGLADSADEGEEGNGADTQVPG